jgi:TRAP-type mannitol/chloroaromatic compound transport system permease small subunit
LKRLGIWPITGGEERAARKERMATQARGGTRMTRIADLLYRATLALCVAALAVMFTTQIAVVFMRYVMGVGFLPLQDLVTYSFSTIVVLTIPLAMHGDRHVRVDILRAGFSARRNRLIDAAGHLFFTLPVFGFMAYTTWPFIARSWAILEGSRETGGLGGLFLVKSTVLVMCVLVIAFAVYEIMVNRAGKELRDES